MRSGPSWTRIMAESCMFSDGEEHIDSRSCGASNASFALTNLPSFIVFLYVLFPITQDTNDALDFT
jgi:hypothetical protein